MRWAAVIAMWLAAATAVGGCAWLFGPGGRVAAVWVAAFAFAAAAVGTAHVVDAERRAFGGGS